MKKEVLIYIIIFILAFGITSGILFFLSNSAKKERDALKADSLKQKNISALNPSKDSLSLPSDSLIINDSELKKMKEEDAKIDSLKKMKNLTKEEKDFINIIERIRSLNREKQKAKINQNITKKFEKKMDNNENKQWA